MRKFESQKVVENLRKSNEAAKAHAFVYAFFLQNIVMTIKIREIDMKKILLLSLAVVLLTACKSREQRLAEDYLKEHMKCPSTLKVVEFTKREVPEEVRRDTLYRISKIKGKKIWDGSYPKSSAKMVYVDSVRESVTTICRHTICNISFDAQNLMGATIRDQATIVLEFGEIPYFYENWSSRNEHLARLQPAWAERIIVSEYGLWCPSYFHIGDWIEKSKLCK